MTITQYSQNHLQDREFAIGLAMRDVAAELRLVEPVDYINFIGMEQYSNLEDIVNSSSELIFAPGTLTFGWGADVKLAWDRRPEVYLDMEFRADAVTAFFSLGLRGEAEFISIRMITFPEASTDPLINTGRLVAALNGARVTQNRT
jgi:hypothetical protein